MTLNHLSLAEELCALCDKLCDGNLAPADRERIETLVLSDPALRRLYVEHMQMHAQLIQQSAGLSEASLSTTLLTPPAQQSIKPTAYNGRLTTRLLNAAAVILLLVTGAWWLSTQPGEPVAVLQAAQNARWGDSTLATAPGSELMVGRLQLLAGLARIRFQNGAKITIEGPTDFELITVQNCRLHSGSLVAHIPPAASGFTVLTSQVTLIDHGTDFSMRSDQDGNAIVHVMQGMVVLHHRTSGAELHLQTNDMAAVSANSLQQLASQDNELGNLHTQPTVPIFTQKFSTLDGQGAAAYVMSPSKIINVSDTLLLIKNAHQTGFLRKAYLRFDLSLIREPDQLKQAQITFYFEKTGYGLAALSGDAHIVVYALTDDSQDAWTTKNLTWDSMPAFHADAGKVDDNRAVKIGEFIMPQGVLDGPMTIDSKALLERIRLDSNRLLTLIVVRENPITHTTGIVHGFAGNNHPTLPPPTLRLR